MILVQEAKDIIAECVGSLAAEQIDLQNALGRTLAEDVYATHDLAEFASSGMDGYAIAWTEGEDCTARKYELIDTSFAGDNKQHVLIDAMALKIMTGSLVPPSAGAIIQREWASEEDGQVSFAKSPTQVGMNIRAAGLDFKQGDKIFGSGVLLRAAELGLLAQFGIAKVAVFNKPRVAVLTTGDELLELTDEPKEGCVRNSNALYLTAALSDLGCEVTDFGIVADEPDVLVATFKRALSYDIIITTGGVSVGDKDYVRRIWGQLDATEKFWRIKQRPGKPMFFAIKDERLIFGIPGNPGAVMVCTEQYVKPAIRRLLGWQQCELPETTARLEKTVQKKEDFVHFFRSSLKMRDGKLSVRPVGNQSSLSIANLPLVNAIIAGPAGEAELVAGQQVPVQILEGNSVFS